MGGAVRRGARGRSKVADGLGYLLSQQLVAAGERVVDVPATLAARTRVLATGRSNKNDPNDARSVAVTALRPPALRDGATGRSRRRCCDCWRNATTTIGPHAPGRGPHALPAGRARSGRDRQGSSTLLTSIGPRPTVTDDTGRARSASTSPSSCSTTSAASTASCKASHRRIRHRRRRVRNVADRRCSGSARSSPPR